MRDVGESMRDLGHSLCAHENCACSDEQRARDELVTAAFMGREDAAAIVFPGPAYEWGVRYDIDDRVYGAKSEEDARDLVAFMNRLKATCRVVRKMITNWEEVDG